MKLDEMVKGILKDLGCKDVEIVKVGITDKKEIDKARLDKAHIEVDVTAKESGEVKHYDTLDEFIREWHFWMCGGAEKSAYDGDVVFEKMAATLGLLNEHGMTIEKSRSGLLIRYTYYRHDGYDRFMKRKKEDPLITIPSIANTLTELKAQSIQENNPYGKGGADKQIIAISRTLRACGYDFQYLEEDGKLVAHIFKKNQ